MKHVNHDRDDDRAHRILAKCRRAVSEDGALLLVEYTVPEGNSFAGGEDRRYGDDASDRTEATDTRGVRELLAGAGFRINRIIPVHGDLSIIESRPV